MAQKRGGDEGSETDSEETSLEQMPLEGPKPPLKPKQIWGMASQRGG